MTEALLSALFFLLFFCYPCNILQTSQVLLGASEVMMTFSDEELMVMFAAGVSEAFDMLYERYRNRLFGFALTSLRNREDAEDVVQEVFIRVAGAARRYQPSGKFKSWLFTIAANRIRSVVERSRYQVEAAQEFREQGQEPKVIEQEHPVVIRDLIVNALSTLPETQRMILILKEVEGMDCYGIAEVLELSSENVRIQLHRARQTLATCCSQTRKGAVS